MHLQRYSIFFSWHILLPKVSSTRGIVGYEIAGCLQVSPEQDLKIRRAFGTILRTSTTSKSAEQVLEINGRLWQSRCQVRANCDAVAETPLQEMSIQRALRNGFVRLTTTQNELFQVNISGPQSSHKQGLTSEPDGGMTSRVILLGCSSFLRPR